MKVSEVIQVLKRFNQDDEVGILYFTNDRLAIDKPVKIKEAYVIGNKPFENRDDAFVELNNSIAIKKKYPNLYDNKEIKLEKVVCLTMDWK